MSAATAAATASATSDIETQIQELLPAPITRAWIDDSAKDTNQVLFRNLKFLDFKDLSEPDIDGVGYGAVGANGTTSDASAVGYGKPVIKIRNGKSYKVTTTTFGELYEPVMPTAIITSVNPVIKIRNGKSYKVTTTAFGELYELVATPVLTAPAGTPATPAAPAAIAVPVATPVPAGTPAMLATLVQPTKHIQKFHKKLLTEPKPSLVEIVTDAKSKKEYQESFFKAFNYCHEPPAIEFIIDNETFDILEFPK